jgi:hypothetical protein
MAINFASDGGEPVIMSKARRRERLQEEKELIHDRLDALDRAIHQMNMAITMVETVDYYRREAAKEGYTV